MLSAAERSLRQRSTRSSGRCGRFSGPAFVAAVAYIDPGNFATNVAAGAKYGYLLLWVVLVSNLMAMLIQSMSAKLGIATGLNLPEACRERFSRPVSLALWVQAEVIAMATDLAEVIGAALGLNLLFGIPLFPAALIAGAFSFGILALHTYGGFRRLEAVIVGFVGIILVGFAVQVVGAEPVRERGSSRGFDAEVRRHRQHPAGRRHPGRDRHAPRHLPALGAHTATGHARVTTGIGSSCFGSSGST